MSSGKWRPSCLGLNVLSRIITITAQIINANIHFESRDPAWIQDYINGILWSVITYGIYTCFPTHILTQYYQIAGFAYAGISLKKYLQYHYL